MIHRIVKDALKEMDEYDIPKYEQFELIYVLGRIESSYEHQKGYRRAMEELNHHLEKHYQLKEK